MRTRTLPSLRSQRAASRSGLSFSFRLMAICMSNMPCHGSRSVGVRPRFDLRQRAHFHLVHRYYSSGFVPDDPDARSVAPRRSPHGFPCPDIAPDRFGAAEHRPHRVGAECAPSASSRCASSRPGPDDTPMTRATLSAIDTVFIRKPRITRWRCWDESSVAEPVARMNGRRRDELSTID